MGLPFYLGERHRAEVAMPRPGGSVSGAGRVGETEPRPPPPSPSQAHSAPAPARRSPAQARGGWGGSGGVSSAQRKLSRPGSRRNRLTRLRCQPQSGHRCRGREPPHPTTIRPLLGDTPDAERPRRHYLRGRLSFWPARLRRCRAAEIKPSDNPLVFKSGRCYLHALAKKYLHGAANSGSVAFLVGQLARTSSHPNQTRRCRWHSFPPSSEGSL